MFLKHHFHPHPPKDFLLWWEPTGKDPKSGASTGGHPEAFRVWARPGGAGGFERRSFGIPAVKAWNIKFYHDLFLEWKRLGYPERGEEFVSLAAPLDRQKEFKKDLVRTLHAMFQSDRQTPMVRPLINAIKEF